MFKAKNLLLWTISITYFAFVPHWFFKNMQYSKEFIYKRMFVDF